mgnify:FL=1
MRHMRPVHQYNNDGCLCRRFPTVWHHGNARAVLPVSAVVPVSVPYTNNRAVMPPDSRYDTVPALH